VDLVRLARDRKQPFTGGDGIAGLATAGLQENSIVELARLNQLASWGGQAQIMRLAGLSDEVILHVARRRAAGQTVLSGVKVAELQNTGISQADLLGLVDRGTTDAEADAFIAHRKALATSHGFVRQRGRRR
jgi:hypothetical protein